MRSAGAIKVGIVGLGRSGWDLHVRTLKNHPSYEIAAVCDVNQSQLEQSSGELGCASYTDFARFLDHHGLELIVIASPTKNHAWMAREALKKGFHVVLEKPLAQSVDEAEPLEAIAKAVNRILCPHYNYRFSRDYLLIKSILAEGLIGRPFLIRRQMGYFNRRDDWQAFVKEGGGILGAATIHFVDQILQLAGEIPSDIWADVRRLVAKGDAPDHSKILLRFPSGCVGDVEVSWVQALPGCDWLIYGPTGAIRQLGKRVDVRWFVEEKVWIGSPRERSYLSNEEIDWREQTYEAGEGFSSDYYDMLAEAIRNGRSLPVTWESAMESFHVVERCFREGCP